jgi:hypothetical protein
MEATEEFRHGMVIPGDRGAWERPCNKMAAGGVGPVAMHQRP